MLNVSKSDVLHSHFHNAGRIIPRIVLRWFSSIPEPFVSLVDGGHTAWIHCFWALINFIVSAGDFPTPTQNLISVTAQLNVTRWRHHVLTLLVKSQPHSMLRINRVQILRKWRRDVTAAYRVFATFLHCHKQRW